MTGRDLLDLVNPDDTATHERLLASVAIHVLNESGHPVAGDLGYEIGHFRSKRPGSEHENGAVVFVWHLKRLTASMMNETSSSAREG